MSPDKVKIYIVYDHGTAIGSVALAFFATLREAKDFSKKQVRTYAGDPYLSIVEWREGTHSADKMSLMRIHGPGFRTNSPEPYVFIKEDSA